MKLKFYSCLNFPLVSAIALQLGSSFAHAGQIWDGTGGDNNWGSAANWDSDLLPTFTNPITFTGNTRNGAVNNLTAASIIGGINLTNDGTGGKTNAFTLSGNSITLGGDITTTASSTVITDTISLAMILDGNRTFTTNTNHNLTISGVVSETGGPRNLVKNGAGTLTFDSINTYSGTTTINAGTVEVRAGTSGGSAVWGTGPITLGQGALLLFNPTNQAIQNTGGFTISGPISLSGGAGTATIRFTGNDNKFVMSGGITGQAGVSQTLALILGGTGTGDRLTSQITGAIADGAGGTLGVSVDFAGSSSTAQRSYANLSGQNTFSGDLTITNSRGLNGSGTHPGAWLTIGGLRHDGFSAPNLVSQGTGYLGTGADYSGNISISNGTGGLTTLSFLTSANQILRGIISGTGSLNNQGNGTLTLTNASNSYTGGTTINGGILGFASGALGTSGTINASGGTLRWLSGNSQDISSRLATTSGQTSTLDTNGNNVTFANALGTANTGALVKTGLGTLTLQATNNYTGTTTVNGGTLSLDYTSNNSKLADGAALILGGGTINLSGGSHTEIVSATTLTNATASYVTQSSGSSILQLGTITNGTGTVNFGASSIATTNNTNTNGILGTWATVGDDWAINSTNGANGLITAYTGYTDLTRQSSGSKAIADGTTSNVRIIEGTGGSPADITVTGTIAINTLNQSSSGGTGAATIALAGQTLRTNGILMGSTAGALTIGASAGSGTLSSTAATGSIIVTNNSTNALTINSVIANNTTTNLVKNGTGVLILTGVNTYTGGTFIQDGTIRVGATTASILGGIFNTGLTIANKSTAVFDLNNFNATIKDLHGGGSLGGNVTLGSGTLTINNPSNGANAYHGVISGTGNLVSGGSSSWNTTGAHTYTGTTTAASSGLFITNNLADGGIASGIGASSSAAANLIFTGGSVSYSGTAAASTNRQFTLTGNGGFGVESTGAITWSNTAAVTYSGVGTRTLNFVRDGAGLGTLAASIGDNGASAVSINKTGTSSWRLTNTGSAFTGAITFSGTGNSGTLAYASAGGANAITFSQTSGSATLSYIGSGQTMSGAITANALSTGTITLDASGAGAINYSNTASLGNGGASGAKGLVLSGTNTGNNTLAGSWVNNAAGGAATLTKNGAGKWVLTGSNTYTGATTVNAGAFFVNGSITSAVTVASGATFGGSGSNTGTVSISGGGTFAAGNSIESLASGDLTLAAAAIFAYEMNNDAAASVAGDLADVTGNLTLDLGNASILTLTELGAGSWTVGEKLTLISYTGTRNAGLFTYLGNVVADDSTINFSGMNWTFNYNDASAGTNYNSEATGTFVTMTAIPEPSAVLLCALGTLLLLRRRRN